jgi:hypothetical protein
LGKRNGEMSGELATTGTQARRREVRTCGEDFVHRRREPIATSVCTTNAEL